MNPQQAEPRAEMPQKPERTSTSSLLESIMETGVRQEYARELIQTEVDNKKFEFEWRLARTFADSGEFDLVKGKTPEQAIASAMAKIQMGKYWGINPADSMRFIRFDRGKPVLENEIIAAKLQEAGWEWDLEFDYDNTDQCTGCRLYPRRKDKAGEFHPLVDRKGEEVVIEFNESDASKAMIYEKDKWIKLLDKWNFKSWAADMYYTKVIARFKRRYAPGVLVGARTMDEVGVEFEPPADNKPTHEADPFTVTAAPKSEPAKVVTITDVLKTYDPNLGAKSETTDEIMREELGKALAEPPTTQGPASAPNGEPTAMQSSPRGRKAKPEIPAKPSGGDAGAVAGNSGPQTTGGPSPRDAKAELPPSGAFQPVDDDLPENLRGPAEKTMLERLGLIRDYFCSATGLGMNNVRTELTKFMRAFLNTPMAEKLSSPSEDPEIYQDVVAVLEGFKERFAAKDLKWKNAPLTEAGLMQNADELGKRSRAGLVTFAQTTAKWAPENQDVARKEALRKHPDYPANLVIEGKTGAPLAEGLVMESLGEKIQNGVAEQEGLW